MEYLGEVELFSRTFDNRFVFNLFDLLLCGVIVLVILRSWRARTVDSISRDRLYLLLAFVCLGASFACGAIFAGAYFFFRVSFSESTFNLIIHAFWASAWLMLVASAYERPAINHDSEISRKNRSLPLRLLAILWLIIAMLLVAPARQIIELYSIAGFALDVLNLLLVSFALVSFYLHPLGKRNFARSALIILFAAASLHLVSYSETSLRVSTIIWNLEQFTWSLALFTFALAIGEIGRDLFDRVFVALQVTFILLASVMILVITQTEKTEYLTSIRASSNRLAEFVRANADYLGHRGETLPQVIARKNFLQRALSSFGHIPELRMVRIAAAGDAATFEIADDGEINQRLEELSATNGLSQVAAEKYFLINNVSLDDAGLGEIEFYGTREILDRHIRKRIITIFSIFTGMVALSTFMIGFVVRGASVIIRKQEREIERANHQLMQASKLAAIGQLAAGVAHEINNPATTILSRASFLLSDGEENISASGREDLEAVVAQSERIARITNNLLMFSRPQVRNLKPVAIDRVVESSFAPVRETIKAHGVSLEIEAEAALPRVCADEQALMRALENLYRNAIDAMPGGGMLRVRAAHDEQSRFVRLEISDTGIGIEKENLARIFDPFFTTKEVGKGTGLGLSIAHGIIREHQGTIVVESVPGKGTTFTITLPTEE
ncbi:MAG TPA: ATP-binding protein [Blastocatellia bacterium]|nr:ATP-binding protein [Blastocatellia bacterium]